MPEYFSKPFWYVFKFQTFVVISAILATAFAQVPVGPGPHHAAPHHVPVYNYEYAVQDDKTPPHYQPLKFGQTEHRDGYVTKGSYHVLLPDGRIQTVTYSVDGEYGGYVADVSEK